MGLIEIGSAWVPGRAVGPSPNGEPAWSKFRGAGRMSGALYSL